MSKIVWASLWMGFEDGGGERSAALTRCLQELHWRPVSLISGSIWCKAFQDPGAGDEAKAALYEAIRTDARTAAERSGIKEFTVLFQVGPDVPRVFKENAVGGAQPYNPIIVRAEREIDLALETARSLRAHALRFTLTALGVAWGAFMLTYLTASMEGMQRHFHGEFMELGPNLVFFGGGRVLKDRVGERAAPVRRGGRGGAAPRRGARHARSSRPRSRAGARSPQ